MNNTKSLPYLDAWQTGPNDTRIYTRTYTPPNPIAVVAFVHGAAEHCGRYTQMHTSLSVEHSVAVFAYDQRGYGRTALDIHNRTDGVAYGKTSWDNQLEDLEWALRTTKKFFPNLPTFLMGTSMGGGVVLGYLARPHRPSDINEISGVIAGSPCIKLTSDPGKAVLWLAQQISRLNPYMTYPVRNKPEDLSRNEGTNAAYQTDPLIRTPGSLRSIRDMIIEGGRLLTENYVYWPENVPVLFMHGTADQVTSAEATRLLYEKIPAGTKELIEFQDARHELHNEPEGVKESYLLAIVDFITSRA